MPPVPGRRANSAATSERTTVAAYAREDLLEKRRPVMQRWAECIAG